MLKIALFLACGCVVIGPGAIQTTTARDVPAALGGIWLAEDIAHGGVIDFLETTLEINDDGTYSGFAGCNSFTGTFDVGRKTIAFAPPEATTRTCVPAVMDQEVKFLSALKEVRAWHIDGAKLVLEGPQAKTSVRLASHARSS
ncbi:META domain-containing protein [Pararhizobium gei]|uniref:META domain-containing protein n=1 Tax=Pararhizobium gei TaxID=1395951 RepID=UPI0023DB90D3|nr:META domain-containing protein [Rhizobium gei]